MKKYKNFLKMLKEDATLEKDVDSSSTSTEKSTEIAGPSSAEIQAAIDAKDAELVDTKNAVEQEIQEIRLKLVKDKIQPIEVEKEKLENQLKTAIAAEEKAAEAAEKAEAAKKAEQKAEQEKTNPDPTEDYGTEKEELEKEKVAKIQNGV